MPRYYNGINPEDATGGGGGSGGGDIVGNISTNGVVYAKSGLIYTEAAFTYNDSTNTLMASNISGAITTANQSNITTIGTQTSGLNIAAGQTYKIDGTEVLSSSTLGSGITTSSLTSVGLLSSLGVTGIMIVGGQFSANANATITGTLSAVSGVNVSTGQTYKINSTDVLSATTLGSAVVNSSLTSVGTLTNLTINGFLTQKSDANLGDGSLFVNSTTKSVGVFVAPTLATLDVSGDINASDDYKIGGFTILDSTTLASSVVTSSLTSVGTLAAGLNIATGQTYRINGVNVLNATTLGSAVVNSSLTSVGTLGSLTVTNNTQTGQCWINAGNGVGNALSRCQVNEGATNLIALRVYNTGTGNCFQIDDSASDTSLTVVDNAGNMYLGSNSLPSASAKLALVSTTQGFLPPVMTTTQKNAISSPAAGLMIFDSTLAKLAVYTGSAWETVDSS